MPLPSVVPMIWASTRTSDASDARPRFEHCVRCASPKRSSGRERMRGACACSQRPCLGRCGGVPRLCPSCTAGGACAFGLVWVRVSSDRTMVRCALVPRTWGVVLRPSPFKAAPPRLLSPSLVPDGSRLAPVRALGRPPHKRDPVSSLACVAHALAPACGLAGSTGGALDFQSHAW